MQVVAFSTPTHPDWRWRIVDYEGEMVEESRQTFPSIATAVSEGARRLREIADHDTSARTPSVFGAASYRRNR